MPVHDAYARLTPFEIAFPDGAERLVDSVRAELDGAEAAGDVRTFLASRAVGAALEDLRGKGTGSEAVYPFGMLAYHAFHFVRAGRPVLLLEAELVRHLVEDTAGAGAPTLPSEAGYAQLPQHLVWLSGGRDGPESVDGFFWTRSPDGVLHLLLAMGVRRDRPGLVVAPAPDAPWSDAGTWLDARIRAEGRDFATTLPGGELEELHSIETAGELFKLTARLMAYLHRVPGASVEGRPGDPPADGPPASRLPYRRITLRDTEHGQRIEEGA